MCAVERRHRCHAVVVRIHMGARFAARHAIVVVFDYIATLQDRASHEDRTMEPDFGRLPHGRRGVQLWIHRRHNVDGAWLFSLILLATRLVATWRLCVMG